MTKLSDTQAVILSAAAQSDGHNALPLPPNLRGGAAAKVVETMIVKGLIEEVDANLRGSEPVWRETGDGHGVTLVATRTGLAAIGIEPEAPTGPARNTREGSKKAQLIAMLRRPEGATIAEIAETLEWRAHTVRGAIAGALKKKLGLEINSKKVEGRGRVYQIPD